MLNWYFQSGKESDVVLSTKVRFSRNIEGFPFVYKLNNAQTQNLLSRFKDSGILKEYGLKFLLLKNMDVITKKELVEKRIVTSKFIDNDVSSDKALLINEEENIAIMINEDDHFVLNILSSGFELENSLNLAMEIENKFDRELKFAFNEKYGYLTTFLTNVGTGLKVSLIVHLPALAKTHNISQVLEAINSLGINIKSVYGENSRNKGNIYEISSKQTLGISENDTIKNLKAIVDKIVEQERLARKILSKNSIELEDNLYRAYGILINARRITLDEMRNLLSDVRLGVDMGIIKDINDLQVNKIDILSKSASLQKYFGESLDAFDRSVKRAELVKKILKNK